MTTNTNDAELCARLRALSDLNQARHMTMTRGALVEAADMIEALGRERDAAVRDAERYRWLRTQTSYEVMLPNEKFIDAAIASGPIGSGG